jgi:hypothetical protein
VPDKVVHTYNTSYWGGGDRTASERQAQEKLEIHYLKNKIQTKGLGDGSSGRDPGCKPQYSTHTCTQTTLLLVIMYKVYFKVPF